MKNHSNFIRMSVCFLAILGIYGCGQKDPDKNEEDVEINAPAQIIDIAQAKTYYDTYGERRVPIIQKYEDSINGEGKMQKKNDAQESFDVGRFVYYDYKTIKQYLAYIEQEAKAANVEISTLRFYYSNYPDQTFFPASKDSIIHPRQNSILISPTYNDGKRDYLFYIGQGAEGQEAIPLADNFEPVKGYGLLDATIKKSYASFTPNFKISAVRPKAFANGESLTLNRGTGVPPPKNQ